MALQRSHTATIARNEIWAGEVFTEPYEAGWAHEAIFFVRALTAASGARGIAHVQISPDGTHWVDEGTSFDLPLAEGQVGYGRVTHFGGYLRLRVHLPEGAALRVIAALALKE